MVVSQEQAMEGEMPDFQYQMLFKLAISQQERNISYKVEYGEEDERLRDKQYQIEELDKMAFICLNNKGRSNEVKSARLKKGDYLRMGRVYLKVVETHLSRNERSPLSSN